MAEVTIPDEAVEVAARALCIYDGLNPDEEFDGRLRWAEYEHGMRAALTAAAPMMVGWRKLEGETDPTKAPWDGKAVLLHVDWEPVTVVGYWEDGWRVMWDGTALAPEFTHVTHWQTLPPPPAETQP